ncbi:MAG: hypothetical protein H6P95_2765 [Candidatus Aminicenantes bacterium]|nr:hypothetical protein [Candidatus Aminicenantes bacterium]
MPDHPLSTMRKLDPEFMKHLEDTDALVYADGALRRFQRGDRRGFARRFPPFGRGLSLCRLVRPQGSPGVDRLPGAQNYRTGAQAQLYSTNRPMSFQRRGTAPPSRWAMASRPRVGLTASNQSSGSASG